MIIDIKRYQVSNMWGEGARSTQCCTQCGPRSLLVVDDRIMAGQMHLVIFTLFSTSVTRAQQLEVRNRG
jgi:hypothetical protein